MGGELQGTDDLCCRVSFFVAVALRCAYAPCSVDSSKVKCELACKTTRIAVRLAHLGSTVRNTPPTESARRCYKKMRRLTAPARRR